MRRTPLSAALFVVSFVSRAALAQPAEPPARPPVPTPPAPTVPTAQLPPEPEVDDPMLAAVARPKTEIATWEDALRHVRARSTDLRIAAQEIARAEAQSRIALAGALTTVTGQGTYTHNIITNPTLQPARAGSGYGFRPVRTPFPDFVNGSLVASQPVFAMRSWYAIGTAEHNESIAHLSLEDTKRLIALNVANAIVGVVTAERLAELNRLGLRNALTRLELAKRRSTLGSGTGLDVVRARQDVETARAVLVAGDESLRQSREALGLALGLPEQVGVPPTVDINGLEASARASCKAAPTIDDRPDLAALHERTEVARRLVKDAKYQFVPTVDVRSAVGTTTIDTGAAPNTTWNVQAVLTVPIWDGGIRYGNLRDTRAQEIIAGQRLEAARRQATIEVTQARRGVSVAEDRRRVAGETRDLAAENDRLTRTAYLEGRGTSLELVTAAQALREAEIQLAVRDFELVRARVLAILALASCPW
ncbi:MAG: TolC family protein [Labilithrix sp.]|nr:TolC family protein [Labilithrix sp.]